ncbi:deoxyguanosinetriphosphate triphosphohydrolase [Candidatus Peregrinibacteria bacterium]|jgi:dGTPase|nr:deoxyguanosinetriphosphate triphosphohydrolase [Candidatus Peregrinibacteria bacterium]
MILTRQQLEEKEEKNLMPYACRSKDSQGRGFNEKEDSYRTCFQRDRDRIIHSKAFRRLKGKTQVFVTHHGDHYRSRLTHTMEVAQISRDMSRSLGLNEDLAESIALAHDLGHTPFGHAGEQALNKKMEEYGSSFEHNKQSLRIITTLERRNLEYKGLNLSEEIIIGMGKHEKGESLEIGALPYLEAQVVNIADEIAYHNHDIDDGIRSGILKAEDLSILDIWKDMNPEIALKKDKEVWISRCVGKLIDSMVKDVYAETEKRIIHANIVKLNDIQRSLKKVVSFSQGYYEKVQALRAFLFRNLYRFKTVEIMNKKGQEIISKLFDYFYSNTDKLPTEYQRLLENEKKHEVVKDYIAGMTDSFAEELYSGIPINVK